MFEKSTGSKTLNEEKNNTMASILDISQVTMDFGGLRAIDAVDLSIAPAEIVALIGPNGAGKTTLFNCITGIYAPTQGTIRLALSDGRYVSLIGCKPNRITGFGIARTFQNIRLFANMTVLENVMIGRHCRMKAGILGAVLRNRKTREEEEKVVADSYRLLETFQLHGYVNEFAKNLPYGAQRRLEIARAMATEPKVLLLDEPAAGMNAQETLELNDMIVQLKERENISIFLIEHDMRFVMSLSDRIYVVDHGKLIAQGTPQEVSRDTAVIKAYLGEGD